MNRRIFTLSRFLKKVFWVLLVGWPVALAVTWFQNQETGILAQLGFTIANALPNGLASHILTPLTTEIKWLGFLVNLISAAVGMSISYLFIRLFTHYQQNEIFTVTSIRLIKRIGLIMLLWAMVNPLYQLLISAVMTWYNPVGERLLSIYVGADYFRNLITAGMVFLIAYLMQEGLKMREEQALTV